MTEKTRLPSSFFINPRRVAAIVALLVLLTGLVLGWQLSIRYQAGILATERQDAEAHLKIHGSILNVLLQHRFGLLTGLKSYSEEGLSSPVDHNGQTFRALAVGLYSSASGVRNFSIAPEGIQKYVYPLEGNENVLGHDLLHDKRPAVHADVQRAIETGAITLSGPYELRQGGLGLVARQAVYQQGRFWGLVAMVLDMPPILAEAGLNEEHELMSFVLQDQKGKVFFGDASILTKQPVSYQVPIHGHVWIISAAPTNGWQVLPQILWLVYGGAIVLPILLAALAYQLVHRQVRMEQLVVERTKELFESEHRFRSLFENTEVSVWDEDLSEVRKALDKLQRDGVKDLRRYLEENRQAIWDLVDMIQVTHVNQATLRLFGAVDEEEMLYKIGTTFGSNAMEVFLDELCAIWDAKKFFRTEVDLRTLDGKELNTILSFKIPELTEGYKSVPISIIDITALKKADEERIRINTQLDTKNREMEQVMYVTSHDLRTPLVSIEGFSSVLEDSLRELLSVLDNEELSSGIKEQLEPFIHTSCESIAYISKGVEKMDLLLKGLSQVASLGMVEFKNENLDMNKLLSNIQGSFKFHCEEQKARIEISELPSCLGDEGQINRLFTNLIGNALKYSDPDRPLVISISGYKEGDHSIYCVEDNGVGIAPEFQEKIFDIFHQLDPEVSGEGLGLNIVYRIVERHNGRVWVESELGKGSRFYFSLLGVANNA